MKSWDWAPPQRDREEWLDVGRASHCQIRESLRDLRRVNLWLGNAQLVVNETFALLQKYDLKRATILDVGTGSADLPAHLLRAASTRHQDLKIIALDCKAIHLRIAREFLADEPASLKARVLLLGGDAFRLPLRDASVDLVISSLFLHHFRPPQIENLLNEFSRVSRVGWVMNDLVRHYAPLVFFKAAWPIFARSAITRLDGAASFRRGYTIQEMSTHIARMNLDGARVQVKPHFFRMTIVGEKGRMACAQQNSMSTFDVCIAGAGIGGACAAIALTKRGARVLLLEAGDFPRHKVCGEFLSPESRAIFSRLKILDEILAAGALEISEAQLVAADGSTLRAALPAPGLALSRFRLDEILWRQAEREGVLCLPNARVKNIAREGERYIVTTSKEIFQSLAAIDATGRARLTSRRAAAPRFLGLKSHFRGARLEDDLVELHFWRGGYCGLVNVEDGLCNVCLLARYDDGNNSPEAVWKRVLASCPALRARMKNAAQITNWLATANVQFTAREPVDEMAKTGVLRVGDAAGYIHPLTGDGMAMAARGGELAAAVIGAQLQGSLSTQDAARLYGAAWRREFPSRLKWGDVLGEALLCPALAAPMIKFLGRTPRLTSTLMRATRGAIVNEPRQLWHG